MWSYGYTDWFGTDGPIDVTMGEASTFVLALAELKENVQKMAVDADEYEMDWYEQLLADISDILDDPGITQDPDMWEDQEFSVLDGAITFYVVED